MRIASHYILLLSLLLGSSCFMKNTLNNNSKLQPLYIQEGALISFLAKDNRSNDKISRWSVYEHLEHILLANIGICKMIIAGETPTEKKRKSILGQASLYFGYIPRGQAESPTYVAPKKISESAIKTMLTEYRSLLDNISTLQDLGSNDVVGNHPYFGGLTRVEWIRFMEVHTNHHLKIVKDIR